MAYAPSDLRNYALGAVVVLASIAAVLTLFPVAAEPSAGGFVLVICLALIAAAAGWALASWDPTVVEVRDAVVKVTRGSTEQQVDLRDPHVGVDLGQKPGSPSWRARFTVPDESDVVVGARQVKARHFTRIVEHHRRHLRPPEPAEKTETTPEKSGEKDDTKAAEKTE